MPRPCYDCGSTIAGHHTPLCEMAEPGDEKDLPQKKGTQHWTGDVPTMTTQITFKNVKGYATYERAKKRGEEFAATLPRDCADTRWVVVALPNGRFTPSFIVSGTFNPGYVIDAVNVCCMN